MTTEVMNPRGDLATRYPLLATSGAGLYLHIPFCLQRCAYCDFASHAVGELPAGMSFGSYTDALVREIESCSRRARADTIYFGGGTPSLLPLDELARVVAAVREAFDVSRREEFTLEANPDTLTTEKLEVWRDLGVTRLSLGIQSLNDTSLKELGRSYSRDEVLSALELHRDELAAFDLSFDLLLGVPWQPPQQALDDITVLLRLKPVHFSLYALKVQPGTQLDQQVKEHPELAPDDDRVVEELTAAEELLAQHGFIRYEVSNFALPEKWSRHNLKYWQGGEYLGFGLNAVSFVDGLRIRNCRNFADYQAALGVGRPPIAEQQELSENERHFERVMLALRTCWGISRDDLPSLLWRELQAKAQELASRYPELMTVTADRIALTSRGMNVEHTLVVELTEGLL